jgi:hypothetical protein
MSEILKDRGLLATGAFNEVIIKQANQLLILLRSLFFLR